MTVVGDGTASSSRSNGCNWISCARHRPIELVYRLADSGRRSPSALTAPFCGRKDTHRPIRGRNGRLCGGLLSRSSITSSYCTSSMTPGVRTLQPMFHQRLVGRDSSDPIRQGHRFDQPATTVWKNRKARVEWITAGMNNSCVRKGQMDQTQGEKIHRHLIGYPLLPRARCDERPAHSFRRVDVAAHPTSRRSLRGIRSHPAR